MNCTRCQGTGFLNLEQVDEDTLTQFNSTGDHGVILDWIYEKDRAKERQGCSCHVTPPCAACVDYSHDVAVCDCCGDGSEWHGTPGEHNGWREGKEPLPQCI
jgi:hypothetical protein